jgi:hypothetical protein
VHDVSVRVNKMRAAVQSIRNKRFAHAYCSHFKTKKRKSHMETPACVCRSCQFTRSFRAFYSSCAQAQKAKSKKWVGKGVRARVITHAHQVLIPIGVRIEREREREKGGGKGWGGGFHSFTIRGLLLQQQGPIWDSLACSDSTVLGDKRENPRGGLHVRASASACDRLG